MVINFACLIFSTLKDDFERPNFVLQFKNAFSLA